MPETNKSSVKSYDSSLSLKDWQTTGYLILYVIVLLSSILIVTHIGSAIYFYVLAGVTLSVMAVLSVYEFEIVSFERWFFVLFSTYFAWMGFLVLTGQVYQRIGYIASTTVVFISLIGTFPKYLNYRRNFLPQLLSYLGVCLVLIGFVMLILETRTGFSYSKTTGDAVLNLWDIRISSLFTNSNIYGIFMCYAALSSLYLRLKEYTNATVYLLINLSGLVLTDGHAAYAGFLVGAVLLLQYKDSGYLVNMLIGGGIVFVGLVVAGVFDGTFIGTQLSGRNHIWKAAVRRLITEPMTAVPQPDLSRSILPYFSPEGAAYEGEGPHNSYLSVMLLNGVVAGGVYILSIFYIAIASANAVRTLWGGYAVAGVCAGIVIMFFESLTLGGLSMSSILLATFVGLAHHQLIIN